MFSVLAQKTQEERLGKSEQCEIQTLKGKSSIWIV